MNNITKNFVIIIISICAFYILVPKIFKPDCESDTQSIKDEECEIKIEKIEHTSNFKIIGTNPKTFEPCECISGTRWWMVYKNEMKEGDYFIKKKGNLFLQIIKADTIIKYDYKCYETEIW